MSVSARYRTRSPGLGIRLSENFEMFDSHHGTVYLTYRMNQTFNLRTIISLDHPELAPYRTLRRPVEHMKQGLFVAEGEKVVRRLLSSDLTVISMLMTPEWFERLFPAHELTTHLPATPAKPINQTDGWIEIFLAEQMLLETIVGYNLHQGIMAISRVPEQLSLEQLIPRVQVPHLLVALDGLVNSENVGVIVRNCGAFGVDAIIVGETSSSPYLRRAVRNSMGSVFRIPVVHAANLAATLSTLHQQHGTRIVAAHPHAHSTLYGSDFAGNMCIVFGNEGEGITRSILDVCTDRIMIPMMNETDSLNVASASAVFLYEVTRHNTPKLDAGR